MQIRTLIKRRRASKFAEPYLLACIWRLTIEPLFRSSILTHIGMTGRGSTENVRPSWYGRMSHIMNFPPRTKKIEASPTSKKRHRVRCASKPSRQKVANPRWQNIELQNLRMNEREKIAMVSKNGNPKCPRDARVEPGWTAKSQNVCLGRVRVRVGREGKVPGHSRRIVFSVSGVQVWGLGVGNRG
ncbi:hypothetical protein DL98DRAFT_13211 [Cadophora sp. DSE1049]|nr:hypothetical protein DL98DRAFT_13211 [Cadophora sp. DSE1049]